MTHPDAETLLRHTEGLLSREEAGQIGDHVAVCPTCVATSTSLRAFSTRLNQEWLIARLRAGSPAMACPMPEEVSEYFLGATRPPERQQFQEHLAGCPSCRALLTKMEHGAAELERLAPDEEFDTTPSKPRSSWWDRVREALGPRPWPTWVGVAAAVGIVFVVGMLSRPVVLGPSAPAVDPGLRVAKPPFRVTSDAPALGIAPSVNPDADRKFRDAMIFHGDADFANRALPSLREAVAIDAGHDQAQFWLGIVYLLRGETKLAIPPLETAVRLAPARAEYGQYLVWAYLRIGALDKALRLQTDLLDRSVSRGGKAG